MTAQLATAQACAEVDRLLALHGADGEAAVAYFSFEGPQSFIGARDTAGALTPLIGFWPLPVRGGELLEAIAAIDENGPRLIANYARTFPELFDEIGAFGRELDPVRSESLGWLLAACSLVIGTQDEDIVRAMGSVETLLTLDTSVQPRAGSYALDSRRLLRSVMSYRIAGVENHVLVRSVFDALGEFAAVALRRLLRDWRVGVVACAGDLFERNLFIAQRARRGLTRTDLQLYLATAGEVG